MVRFAKRFEFGSKAETLDRLAARLTKSTVPDFLSFSVSEWSGAQRAAITDAVGDRFGGRTVIVRSSGLSEDSGESALAGYFCSVGDVVASDHDAVAAAVERVIASYGRHEASGVPGDADNQVIVQQMIKDVLVSGVLFTQDMNTAAPYYVINYDDETGATDTVTAGNGYSNRTLYVFRDAWSRLASRRFTRIIEAVREIEDLTGDSNLDLEFALDRDFDVHIFQVRRITTQQNWNRGQTLRVFDALKRLEEGLADRYGDGESGLGGAILGNMPDWNPAEMIGTTPRPLAFSLYRTLITDRIWRLARRQMGYREPRGMPLMMSLAGQPYIDVRESLSSFVPAALPSAIGDRLVTAWLARLAENHHLHDKLEFDVAITAFTPDFDLRVESQIPGVLAEDEVDRFRDALRHLTNDLLVGRRSSVASNVAMVESLEAHREAAVARYPVPRFETVAQLLEDATELGTLPFSVLARHGFIATDILKGLVRRGVLSDEAAGRFQRSIPTVATGFIRDVDRYATGALSEAALLEQYGHLRPGTYDILSLRYDQQLAALSSPAAPKEPHETGDFEPDVAMEREVSALLAAEGFDVDAGALFAYLRSAIQGREYGKFVFTHSVSDALEIIAALGERHGLSREELSFIDVRRFLDCFVEPSGRSIETELRELSQLGRDRHEVTRSLRLPSLITDLSDLWIVPLMVEQPNYITRRNAHGDVVAVSGSLHDPTVIDGKIVAISSADPGFDWIFTRPILGLVTRFGGANSHMAIRCAELGLPAAIGCGEQIFDRVVKRGRIGLNCADGQIVMA